MQTALHRIEAPNDGFLVSEDSGMTWHSICGPSNWGDTHFSLTSVGIFAGDSWGGLWYNPGTHANGPRLQLLGSDTGRIMRATAGEFKASVLFPKDSYFQKTDSITFRLFLSGPIELRDITAQPGWQIASAVVSDDTVSVHVRRTSAETETPDLAIASLSFLTYIDTLRTATIALDEINFNQDTTFRDCMIASLTKNDSLFVDLVDGCGDSIMREFIRTDGLLRIESLRPNPARAEVTLDVNAATEVNADIEISNALGVVVQRLSREFIGGGNTISIDTHEYPAGMYFVRLSAAGSVVSRSFVKE